jgi:hypothetical protein
MSVADLACIVLQSTPTGESRVVLWGPLCPIHVPDKIIYEIL